VTPAFRSHRGRRDRGVAAVEVLALYPVLILLATFALQAGAAMWTVSATNEAARTAARAYSLGHDPEAAAERSLPGAMRVLDLQTFGGSAHGVHLEVQVPRVSPLPRFTVTREAVLP
jgi:Flp pilus assembly protein TadG